MTDQCVTSSGQIPRKRRVGESVPEGQGEFGNDISNKVLLFIKNGTVQKINSSNMKSC